MGLLQLISKIIGGNKRSQAGNIFMMLFGSVAMVGVVGAATMTILKGPVRTMSEVTKRTVAENNMIASGKLALIAATTIQDGDCDADLVIEPIPFGAAIAGFTGGGALPATIGTSKEDPWGTAYAYCVWDHGKATGDPSDNDADCGGSTNYLAGGDVSSAIVLAIISAGPDGVWNTNCQAFVDANSDDVPDTPLVNKTSGTDDLVMSYTYNEATAMSGGIWALDSLDPNKAEITKNLSVKGNDDIERFGFDADTGVLTIGDTGRFPKVNTDNLQSYGGAGGTIIVNSALNSSENIATTGSFSGDGASITNISGDNIADNTIDSSEIQDNTLTFNDLAPNSVTASEIAANAVGTSEVAANSLTAADLAPNSVGTSEVAANSLTAADLAPNSVGSSEIATNAVTNAKITSMADTKLTGVPTCTAADEALQWDGTSFTCVTIAGGGGGSDCSGNSVSWSGGLCSGYAGTGTNGSTLGVTDSYCCNPGSGCGWGSCNGKIGSATATCTNGVWIGTTSISCSNCGASQPNCGDDDDNDEALDDLLFSGTAKEKTLKAIAENLTKGLLH